MKYLNTLTNQFIQWALTKSLLTEAMKMLGLLEILIAAVIIYILYFALSIGEKCIPLSTWEVFPPHGQLYIPRSFAKRCLNFHL